jgi:SAM-dependent methyltransferase
MKNKRLPIGEEKIMPNVDRTEGRQLFGRDPPGYDRWRPGYPARVYDLLRARCGLRVGTRTFEVGPGTGQATRHLLQMGAAPLVVVEPDERLAAFLGVEFRRAVADRELEIRQETFEDVDLPPSSFDLGVAATSFHWLDASLRLRKVAALLRPGGWWAMWWNVFGDPSQLDAFHEATQDILSGVGRSPAAGPSGGLPHALEVDTRLAELTEVGEFEDISNEMIRWTLSLDTEGVRGLFATFSEITRLPDEQRRQVLDDLARVADERFGGRIEKPMVTAIYTARRK